MVTETESDRNDAPSYEVEVQKDPDELAQEYLERLFGPEDALSKKNNSIVDHGLIAGDLTFGEDNAYEMVTLSGLREDLERFREDEVISSILGQGIELRAFARDVEDNLRQVELESIQDYIKESDNLVSLHTQIKDCDFILTEMENLLGGFQSDLGSISSEIKNLQQKSLSMNVKLQNRKTAEVQLAKFVDDMMISSELINSIVDGEVNETFLHNLEILSAKIKFINENEIAKNSFAINDIRPELERLKSKAVIKSREFLFNKLYALKRPKTNIQILQQNVLLKYKGLILFLKENSPEIFTEIKNNYIDTMSKVLSLHFRTYIMSLEKLQLDFVTKSDLIGMEESKGSGLFYKSRDLKSRSAVFSLGDRASIIKDMEQAAIIPHIAEASGTKFPYELLFRSLHKLFVDTATSEYLFCIEFFNDDSIFSNIFSGSFAVIDEHFNGILPNFYDAIGLLLIIRMTHQYQLIMSRRRVPCLDFYFDKVNLLVWPRFKLIFDMHLNSLKNANARSLWENDVHPHYITRRYSEFASALMLLNTDYGDGQLDLNLDRLRLALDNLLVEISRLFPKQKQRTVFLINNYDLILSVFKEAGANMAKTFHQFEDLLNSFTTIFVEEELREHFRALIDFVKTRAGGGEDSHSSPSSITLKEIEPHLKDFSSRWKSAIEAMHKDVITNFSNFVCGMDILRAALTQLLLYYTRLSDCLKRVDGGSSLVKDVVSIPSIMYEIRKYSRTF